MHGSKLEKEIWDEFHGNWENLVYESELLIARFQNKEIADLPEIDFNNMPQGEDRDSVVKTICLTNRKSRFFQARNTFFLQPAVLYYWPAITRPASRQPHCSME